MNPACRTNLSSDGPVVSLPHVVHEGCKSSLAESGLGCGGSLRLRLLTNRMLHLTADLSTL